MNNEQMRTIVNALTEQVADRIDWQFPCNDCQERHTNFAIYYPTEGQWLVWHNCSNENGYKSQLTSCYSCHTHTSYPAEGPPIEWRGIAYFGCELTDAETMENLAWNWAKEKGIV